MTLCGGTVASRMIVAAALCWLVVAGLMAQRIGGEASPPLTGDLRTDLASNVPRMEEAPAVREARSPVVAALYSAALPGLGQAYGDDWSIGWRSVAFAAVEVGLWVAYASYEGRANRQTDEFEVYADGHWDVTKYVDWIASQFPSANTSGIVTSTDPALPPWERVDWARLNQCEDDLGQTTGNGFTHRLPRRPEQQYYELIGKYAQYGGGWDDAWSNGTVVFTESDLLADRVTAHFLGYRDMRGRANDLYTVARTASYIVVANHVLSALEAAWSTARTNREIQAHAELVPTVRGGGSVEMVPTVNVRVAF